MQTNTSFRTLSSPALPAKNKTWMTSALHGCTILAAFVFVSALVIGIL